jgi:hypothetical protein
MKRSHVLSALASVVVLGVAMMLCEHSISAPLPDVGHYEYCRVQVSNGGWGIVYEARGVSETTNVAPKNLSADALFKQITGQQMPDPKSTSLDIELLNAMGAQGWEVIQSDPPRDGWNTFLLKRRH